MPNVNDHKNAMLVAQALKGVWRASPPDLSLSEDEFAKVLPLLTMSGAGALAWWRLKQSHLRESALTLKAESYSKGAVLDAGVYEHGLKKVLARLKSIDVEPIMIKGWAAARSYARPEMRPWGDIDLVINHEDFNKAQTAIAGVERPVDLTHRDLDNDGLTYRVLMERSQLLRINSIEVRLPCQEDHLRLLCLHFLRHGGWRPLWLCDIAAAVESRQSDFDWDRCLGSNPRRANWVICAIGLAGWLLDAELSGVPKAVNDTKLPVWLRSTILNRWDSPDPMRQPDFMKMRPVREYLLDPVGLFRALRLRWPDPLISTIVLEGRLNGLPRIPYQIGHSLLRAMRFTKGAIANR